ncbi:MAG TPA: hypothetical protein VF444_01035, partial [Pseudonocardiaceae bacterium]
MAEGGLIAALSCAFVLLLIVLYLWARHRRARWVVDYVRSAGSDTERRERIRAVIARLPRWRWWPW